MKKFSWYTIIHPNWNEGEPPLFRLVGPAILPKERTCDIYFKPNRKGGHMHNHFKNVLHRIVIRSKNARKTSRKNRTKWKQRGANGQTILQILRTCGSYHTRLLLVRRTKKRSLRTHRQGKERLQVFRISGARRIRPAPHLSPGAPTNRQRSNRSFFRGLTASFC